MKSRHRTPDVGEASSKALTSPIPGFDENSYISEDLSATVTSIHNATTLIHIAGPTFSASRGHRLPPGSL